MSIPTQAGFIDQLLFGIYPYICASVFVLGSLLRLDRDPYSWRAKSSQMLADQRFVLASNAFHIGIIMLMMGHFVGLLTPHFLYSDLLGLSAANKQLLAIGAGGLFGVLCLVGLLMLLWRRLMHPRVYATSSRTDILLLVVLLAQLLLGLASIPYSADHPDGARMLALSEWAQRIVTFRGGAADYVADAEWVFKAHIFLGLTIFLVFPFTRLVHALSAPLGFVFRSHHQIVRARRGVQ